MAKRPDPIKIIYDSCDEIILIFRDRNDGQLRVAANWKLKNLWIPLAKQITWLGVVIGTLYQLFHP